MLKRGDIVVLESTSPVGATEQMAAWLQQERPDLTFPHASGDTDFDVHVAHCPERILPGHALEELITNDRVIGGMTPSCAERAAEIYRLVVQGNCVLTDCRTAEMAKLTENAFRDVNIAFANELSLICDVLGIDVWELIRLANHHPRVNILQPGPGVGGHCIAVDPWFIVSSAPDKANLIRTAREVNDGKPKWVLDKIAAARAEVMEESGRAPVVACFGLAFKANIDDLRESPAVHIVERLCDDAGCEVLVVEPHVTALPRSLDRRATLVGMEEAVDRADILVVLVNHDAFLLHPVPTRKGQHIIDTRGLWRPTPALSVLRASAEE